MENILFLINHAGKAGTERYVRMLAENADNFGMRPFFAYNEPGLLLEQLQEIGVECRHLHLSRPFDIAAARALALLCEDWKIGIIHTNYLRENYIAILSKIFYNKYIKVIYTNHYVTPVDFHVKLANKIMTRANHKIISVCEAGVVNLINNGYEKKKISIIHNGVDPLIWRPGSNYSGIRAEARREYGIGEDEKVFLCASRFAHDKGHNFLVESLAMLADLYGVKRLRVLLAGDGPLEHDIRAQVEIRGLSDVVVFLGFIKDMKPLFYASDVYVNPSQHEASSFLILEALASGLPVIAANMGGNCEIINEQNGCGALIEYGNAAALCDAIQMYRTDDPLLNEASRKALLIIENKFSLDDMLAKTFASFY